MLDRIRRKWRALLRKNVAHPAKHIWEWAKAPRGDLLRAKRFGRLAVWARKKKHETHGDEKKLWSDRQETYHRKSLYYQEKWERKQARKRRRKGLGQGNPGPPRWSGAKSIIVQKVFPIGRRFGTAITSLKRGWPPGSDHNFASVTAYAVDFGTFDGAALAHAIARELGISNYRTGTFTHYFITVNGNRFRVQILWAVAGHFNHVHVGIRRV